MEQADGTRKIAKAEIVSTAKSSSANPKDMPCLISPMRLSSMTVAAYKVDGVFSESFLTHAEALAAAQSAAEEQEVPGHTETIEYEDDRGNWHTETAKGRDRPHPSQGPGLRFSLLP